MLFKSPNKNCLLFLQKQDRFQDCWKDWSRNRVYSNKKFVLAYQVKAVLSRQIDICVDSDVKKDAFGFATFGLAVLVVTISKQVLARAVGRQALVGHVPRAAELRLRLLQCQNFQEYILGESEIKKAGFVQIKSVLRIAYSNKKKGYSRNAKIRTGPGPTILGPCVSNPDVRNPDFLLA